MILRVAADVGALVLDLRDFGARNLVMTDHVHPTAFGQVWIAERALDVLAADGMDVRVRPSHADLTRRAHAAARAAGRLDLRLPERSRSGSGSGRGSGAPSCSRRLRHLAVAEEQQQRRTPAGPSRSTATPSEPDPPGQDQHEEDDGAQQEQRRPVSVYSVITRRTAGDLLPLGLGAVELGDDEARQRPADHDRAGEDQRTARPGRPSSGQKKPSALPLRTAMNAASAIPNSPPIALITGLRRTSRSTNDQHADRRPRPPPTG